MFTLASLLLMFTHSLKAKSSYHRLLVVSHRLLPSPSRGVWKGLEMVSMVLSFWEALAWPALQMEGMGGCHGPTRAGVMWLWLCACVCVCVCGYLCTKQWKCARVNPNGPLRSPPQPGPICWPTLPSRTSSSSWPARPVYTGCTN